MFILTVLAYVILYAPYGFTDADDGFITALSWRISNGQIPYTDFIYVRPPLTLYLHALPFFFLPYDMILITERGLFFISLAVSSYFGAAAAKNILKNYLGALDLFFLSTIAFVYSVNSFTPMAWHTVDGVLLGSIGLYLLVDRKRLAGTIAGIFFLFLATLTKQSYYLVPFAGLTYIHLSKRDSKETILSGFALLVFVGMYVSLLALTGIFDQFILQTTAVTTFKDAYAAGVYEYLHQPLVYFVIPLICLMIARKMKSNQLGERAFHFVPYCFIIILFAYPLSFFLNKLYIKDLSDFEFYRLEFKDSIANVLLIFGLIYALMEIRDRKALFGILCLILLSWSSSISWVHATPHLFAAPLVSLLITAVTQFFRADIIRYSYFLYFLGIFIYFIAYQKPYNSDIINNTYHDLGEVNEKLNHIYGDRRISDKLKDLQILVTKYGGSITVLPAMPLADFIYDLRFHSPLDWPINAETAGMETVVIQQITRNCEYAIVDSEWLRLENKIMNPTRRYGSLVTLTIFEHWNLIDSTDRYKIYKNPKK